MARQPRIDVGDQVYHCLNRSNGRFTIFEEHWMYQDFEYLLDEVREQYEMRILAYVLMPNHWHLQLYPENDGDMGEFIFSRTADMFSFFRSSGHRNDEHSTLAVNFGYWAEKCEAVDKSDGLRKYDPDRFREVVADILKDDEEATDELRLAVEDEVLCAADDGPHAAHEAADAFEWKGRRYFADFYEHSLEVYTYRFLWCCYAMTWGIAEYDNKKGGA